MKKDIREGKIRKRKLKKRRNAIRIKDPKSPIRVRWMMKLKLKALKQMKIKKVRMLKKIRP